jgi:hypothetical protein
VVFVFLVFVLALPVIVLSMSLEKRVLKASSAFSTK